MDSISEKEFERNGYSVKQKTDSSGGALYTTATRGQEVTDKDTLTIDQRKELHRNLAASAFGAGDDLTQVPTGVQAGAMAAEEGVARAATTLGNVGKVFAPIKNFISGAGRQTDKVPEVGKDIAPGAYGRLPENHPVNILREKELGPLMEKVRLHPESGAPYMPIPKGHPANP
jgi:hypothetical protein